MTHDEIDRLEAGPELDALVAEEVLGWTYAQQPYSDAPGMGWESTDPHGATFFGDSKRALPYSTGIAAAWEVVERLLALRLSPTVYTPGSFTDEELNATDGIQHEIEIWDKGRRLRAEAPTAPLAICRAALKAVNA